MPPLFASKPSDDNAPAAEEAEEPYPQATGDKKQDAYNSANYYLRKMHKATDLKDKAGHYNVVAGMRELRIERGVIDKTDPEFDKLANELMEAYKILEPHKADFPLLIPVLSYDEIMKAKEKKDMAEDQAYLEENVFFGRYSGPDAAALKATALKNFHANATGVTLFHHDFKHGWVVNDERNGERVVAHIKRLRYMFIYKKNDGKYYRAEALFSQRAPLFGSYTTQTWGEVDYYSKNPIPEWYMKKLLPEKIK